MIIYNVTINIDTDVHDEWLSWMRSIHIPEVMQTGCFTEGKIAKIHGQEQGGISYSIQYTTPDNATFERYQHDFAPELQHKHALRYAGKFVAFRTVLSVVEIFST